MFDNRNGQMESEKANSEVVAKAKRRQYSAEFKRRILDEYEASEAGERGALLRREGIYSSYITKWQRQRERGELAGLSGKKRGPKIDQQAEEIARLKKENERLKKRLKQAEMIIDVQKKVSQMLGGELEANGEEMS